MEQFSSSLFVSKSNIRSNVSSSHSARSSTESLSPTASPSPICASRPPSWSLSSKTNGDAENQFPGSPSSATSACLKGPNQASASNSGSKTAISPLESFPQEHTDEQASERLDGERQPENLTYINMRGHLIICLQIDGKERVCLSQISNKLLNKYTYNEIHNRRVALGINCIQCTPSQLELLRKHGAMPITSRRCGMITRREAERLIKSFLDTSPASSSLRHTASNQTGSSHDTERSATGPTRSYGSGSLPNYAHSFYLNDDNFTFKVKHKCGFGCKGYFYPSRYNSSRAKCIRCFYCFNFYSPNKFIFHSHEISTSKNRQQKFQQCASSNFNSWRRHITLITERPSNRCDSNSGDQDQQDEDEDDDDIRNTKTSSSINLSNEDLINAWEDVKSIFNGGKRKRQTGQIKYSRPSYTEGNSAAFEERMMDDEINSDVDYNSMGSNEDSTPTSSQIESAVYSDKLRNQGKEPNYSSVTENKRFKSQDHSFSQIHGDRFEDVPRFSHAETKSEIQMGKAHLLSTGINSNQLPMTHAGFTNDNLVGANSMNKFNQLLNELITKSLGFNQQIPGLSPFLLGGPVRPPAPLSAQPHPTSLLAPSIQMPEPSTIQTSAPLMQNSAFSTQFLAFKSIYESYLYESLNHSLLSNLNSRPTANNVGHSVLTGKLNPPFLTKIGMDHEGLLQAGADPNGHLKMIQEHTFPVPQNEEKLDESSDSSAFKSIKRKF